MDGHKRFAVEKPTAAPRLLPARAVGLQLEYDEGPGEAVSIAIGTRCDLLNETAAEERSFVRPKTDASTEYSPGPANDAGIHVG
jgi:hypothetical protein